MNADSKMDVIWRNNNQRGGGRLADGWLDYYRHGLSRQHVNGF